MSDIYLPYIIGSDSPIPYLFEEIIPHINKYYNIATFCNNAELDLGSNVEEVYAYDPHSLQRRFVWLKTTFQGHDLIHTGGMIRAHYFAAKLTRLRNRQRRHIHTFRVDVDSKSSFDTKTRRKLSEMADVTTAVSEHTAETARRHFEVDPEVIYNGVDSELFHPGYPTPKSPTVFNTDRPIVLFVGSLEDRKRPYDVVRVAREIPEAEYLIVGDGSLFDELQSQCSDLSNVHLTGRLSKEDLPPIYANSDVFLFPSVREGCPNVVLEAMASGTPVIGYRATSMPELIRDGENGYLAPPNNIQKLVELTNSIVNNSPDLLGSQAREYIKTNHTFEQIATNYLNLYSRFV